jgi:Bacterial type III secretion protein (HrpB4)
MTPDPRIALVERLFAAARSKTANVAAQVHPEWILGLCKGLGLGRGESVPGKALDEALQGTFMLRWPSLSQLTRSAHRISLLARPDLSRVLAAVALHAARDGVRRSLNKSHRSQWITAIGEDAYLRLLRLPPRGHQLAEVRLHKLSHGYAIEGQALLGAAGHWRNRDCAAWIRYAIPPPSVPGQPSVDVGRLDPAIFAHLPLLFPEHAWLFGSDMERTLSALTAT